MEKNIKKAVLSNRIYLKRDEKLVDALVSELSYEFPVGKPGSPPERVCNLSGINANIITIPIGRTDLIPKDHVIIDKRILAPVYFPKSSVILRDSQQLIYDTLDDNWIINAKPGWGKTFTAIMIAAKLGQKTLIITHTVKLRKQWEDEVKKVLGIIPSVIGSGKLESDKAITVCNIQTFSKHVATYSSMFGTVITDECHHIPATTFRGVIDKMRARYKIGLSGTLGRRDQKHILLFDYFGKNVYKPPKENVSDPTVLIYNSVHKIPGNHLQPWATRINNLSSNPDYKREIVNLAHMQADRGHKVLILSDRVEFIKDCDAMSVNSEHIVSSTDNQDEKEQAIRDGKISMLWGSTSLYKEGISINELSCVILASPINNVYLLEQIVGRIMRLCEGKKAPEVIDVRLAGHTGTNQFNTRIGYYRKEGYKIVQIPDGYI